MSLQSWWSAAHGTLGISARLVYLVNSHLEVQRGYVLVDLLIDESQWRFIVRWCRHALATPQPVVVNDSSWCGCPERLTHPLFLGLVGNWRHCADCLQYYVALVV